MVEGDGGVDGEGGDPCCWVAMDHLHLQKDKIHPRKPQSEVVPMV